MSDPREKRVELILQQLEELPTLPVVAVRVLEVTSRDDSSFSDIVKLLESDQSLTARILQLVRRADLGIRGEVTTVERAVSLLGFEAVRSATLALCVFDTFNKNQKAGGGRFDRDGFWRHSLAVACLAELLALRLPLDKRVSPSDAFVAGLLHDIGKVALDYMLPKSFNRVVEGADLLRGNIADLERNIIGLDHQVIGKRLSERWQLPTSVRDVAWLHGQSPDALPAAVQSASLVNLITLCDVLVREQHLGYSGNYSLLGRTQAQQALGLDNTVVQMVVEKLVAHMQPRAEALGLGKATADDIYRGALDRANKELGQISNQLAAKNRKLAVRAKYFEAVTAFQGELRPDASPGSVLHAIGQTATEVLGVPSVAVFSLAATSMLPGTDAHSTGATLAEVVLVDGHGDVFDTTVIDCPVRPMDATTGDGPVLAAGDELEWLLSAVSPRLADGNRFWVRLQADGVCIGGVAWGAAAGESQRLATQVNELTALSNGWSLALRTAQVRDESRALAEQLAESNRRLQAAQNEILRSRTMLCVGEMAAGAAHEMNNPLAVISGRSQLLASQLTDPKLHHAATLIYEQSHRLSEIISELMDFAKPVPPTLKSAEVADVLGRSIHDAKMLGDSVDRTIEMTLPEVPPVRVDETQVSAAVAELLANALQATDPVTGKIEVHGGYDADSRQVVLTITDNGCGMDEQTLKRAFDPFFSVKPAGRRRGMGLAKALRWVEASGGSIRLESRPGQGTRSVILLPADVEAARAGAEVITMPVSRRAVNE